MDIKGLLDIMDALRERCPWDAKQTRKSLKPYLVEETYEVIEAIEDGTPEMIKEELGDLLFQIVFHCRIAKEMGEFDLQDVIDGISKKMISRHPHVFGDARCETPEDVVSQWEIRKKEEGKVRESILDGVPRSMPSLLRAHRLQDRAAKAGFDWDKAEDAVLKLDEEVAEFKESFAKGDQAEMEDEFGDILFMLVNLSRFFGVNPDDALSKTISKFTYRFNYIERKAKERGVDMNDMTLSEMDAIWDEAKAEAREKAQDS